MTTGFPSEEHRAVTALHLVPEIGPRRFRRLVSRFGSAAAALAAARAGRSADEGISPAMAAKIASSLAAVDPDAEREAASRSGAVLVTCLDASYPPCLKDLPDGPPVIYVKGELRPGDLSGVAIVGTRRPTAYGRRAAAYFARECALRRIATVSGLARGIDTCAHAETLAAGGRTVAVLGSGLGQVYPPENRALADRIARQGALVSEFPVSARPDRMNFPRRNRLIAALSAGTLVVECAVKSGALITAEFCVEQGREVFAVPGPVFSPYSAGPHRLLKDGACCAESIDDILAALPGIGAPREAAEVPGAAPSDDVRYRSILGVLDAADGGVPFDRIAALTRLDRGELSRALLELELRGAVRLEAGSRYVRR